MQDEIVARLANALNARLVAAEARRAEQAPKPDSIDLNFQGLACFNKGVTPDNLARARSFFDRALAADPGNVDALIGSGLVDLIEGALSFVADPNAAFAAAEAKLTKALSSVRDHALGHTCLGLVDILTKRADRAEETEAHVAEALRLSPRDTWAYACMNMVGLAKLHLGSYEQAAAWFRRSKEANRNFLSAYFNMAAALAHLDRLDEANSAVQTGLALNPAYTVSRVRAAWTARSINSTYLAQLEPVFEGMRKAGVPE